MKAGLGYLFVRAVATTPDKVALIQDATALTYDELDRRANRVARAFQEAGIESGDRVVLLFDNDYRFLECYFGTLRVGAVVVSVNHRLSNETVTYILDHCDGRILVCSASQVDRAAECVGAAGKIERIVALDRSGPGLVSYEDWIAAASWDPPEASCSEDGIAIQAYTAGSTGKPKGCLLSHSGQLWTVAATAPLLSLTPEDRAIVAAPLGHKNATWAIKRLLFVGGSVVLMPAFDPETYLAAIARHGVTCTTGVPAMYQMLLARPELFTRYDTRSVRFCFFGSAQVPSRSQEVIPKYFPNARIRETYGATEAGLLIQPPDGSPGLVPIAGTEVRVIREDRSDCEPDEVGEIAIKNPGVARGYYKNPEATGERIRNGWYYTGDLVRRTSQGRYYVVGRKDDMIITGGENVYPKEVEDILQRHPQVAESCVVPVSHPIKGQVPVAFIVSREPKEVTEPELKAFFLAHGAAFAHPRRVLFVDALPLSAPGKVDRSALRAQAETVVRDANAQVTG